MSFFGFLNFLSLSGIAVKLDNDIIIASIRNDPEVFELETAEDLMW